MMAHTFSTAEISLVALRDLLPPSPSLAGKHAARSPPKMISSFPSLYTTPRLIFFRCRDASEAKILLPTRRSDRNDLCLPARPACLRAAEKRERGRGGPGSQSTHHHRTGRTAHHRSPPRPVPFSRPTCRQKPRGARTSVT
jgi:hypothetical protein